MRKWRNKEMVVNIDQLVDQRTSLRQSNQNVSPSNSYLAI